MRSQIWLSKFAPATILLWPLVGCAGDPPANQQGAAPPAPENRVEPRAEPAPPPRVLQREDILLATARARSDAAAGIDDSARQAPLANQRFSFRIPLGCAIAEGADDPDADALYDPERRRLTLRARANVSLDDDWVRALAGDGADAAEGFWVTRPWLLAPACSGAAATPEVGLVQFFSSEDPRVGRRQGRPFETQVPLAEGAPPPTPGSWHLVIEGRLRAFGDGRAIHCRPRDPAAAPSCLVSIATDRVLIEAADSGEVLDRWERG